MHSFRCFPSVTFPFGKPQSNSETGEIESTGFFILSFGIGIWSEWKSQLRLMNDKSEPNCFVFSMKTESTNFISVSLSQRQSKISQRKHIKIGPLNEPWAYQFISRIESTSEPKAKHILKLSNSTTMYKKIDKLYGGAGRRFEIWRGKVPCLSLFVSSIQVKGIVVFFFSHTHTQTHQKEFWLLSIDKHVDYMIR